MATGKCISVSCVFVFLYSPTVSSGDKSCVPVQAGIVYYFECKAYIISCKKGTSENYIIDKKQKQNFWSFSRVGSDVYIYNSHPFKGNKPTNHNKQMLLARWRDDNVGAMHTTVEYAVLQYPFTSHSGIRAMLGTSGLYRKDTFLHMWLFHERVVLNGAWKKWT